MKNTYLVPRKHGSETYFHFRGHVFKDLIPTFSGRKEFQLSLKNVNNKETLFVPRYLKTLSDQLFSDTSNVHEKPYFGRY